MTAGSGSSYQRVTATEDDASGLFPPSNMNAPLSPAVQLSQNAGGRRAVIATARSWLPPLLLAGALLLLWELAVRVTATSATILPAPSRVLSASLRSAALLRWHAGQTLLETVLGFALAVAVAAISATLLDFSATVKRALLPLLIASQTVPIIALAPLLVLWFGYGILPKVLIVGLVCFFPMVVAAVHGLESTDPELIKLYRSFGASRWQLYRLVRLPTALPSFFAGARIAVTYSVIGAVFGEYVGARRGLGIFLQTAKNSYRTDLVFGMIAVTAALSLMLYAATVLVERLVIPWAHAPAERSSTPPE